MATHPITITDYIRPIECVLNKEHHYGRNKDKSQAISKNLVNDVQTQNNLNIDLYSSTFLQKEMKLVQPGMRYKAKSGVKRILEERNKQNTFKISTSMKKKEAIDLLLKPKIITRAMTEQIYIIEKDEEPQPPKIIVNNNIFLSKANLSKSKEKNLDKLETKLLLNLYKHKTHFKGATDFALSGI